MLLLLSTDFFSNSFKKNFQEHYRSEGQMIWILNWIQTVCKGYQEMTKVIASKNFMIIRKKIWVSSWDFICLTLNVDVQLPRGARSFFIYIHTMGMCRMQRVWQYISSKLLKFILYQQDGRIHIKDQLRTEKRIFFLSWLTARGSGIGSVCFITLTLSPDNRETNI